MTLRDHPYPAFFGFAALLFLAATLGSDVMARITVGDDGLWKAITEHTHYAFAQAQLKGTVMLLVPFLLLGWMSATLAERKGFDKGLWVFLFGALLLGGMYFLGYQDYQGYMKQRMWTAASISVGTLPLKSIPLLLICLGFRWLVAREPNKSKGPGSD